MSLVRCTHITATRTLTLRRHTTTATAHSYGLTDVPILPDSTLHTFRTQAFTPAVPFLLPRGLFLPSKSQLELPALSRWFLQKHDSNAWELNQEYLSPFGDALLPLELTQRDPNTGKITFQRSDVPLSIFLTWAALYSSTLPHSTNSFTQYRSQTDATPSLYLAQSPLASLPALLQHDLPTPSLVSEAGLNDIYSSSVWLGPANSYTPLHRDPNPNLFVQMAGKKVVRLFKPEVGRGLMGRARAQIRGGGGREIGRKREEMNIRGEEMMMGEEREILEHAVWGADEEGKGDEGMEARLERGDALFIPNGWWHSVKGAGEGITGSVNWWFR